MTGTPRLATASEGAVARRERGLSHGKVVELRRWLISGSSIRSVARRFSVRVETAYNAAVGRTWGDVPDVLVFDQEARSWRVAASEEVG